MKKLTVLFLAIALGFGVLGLGSNALATSYDPTGELGSWPVPPTTPMIWNHGQTGDALFGEMYRAVYGAFDDPFNFATYVSIENVSDYWVAAHVRMRLWPASQVLRLSYVSSSTPVADTCRS